MPISQDFKYQKTSSVEEALELLHQYGKRAQVLAGGTDLANMLKQGFPVPDMMVDIKGLEELQQISLEGNHLHIGSLVSFTDIILSPVIQQHMYALWEAAHMVASVGIRNRATMAGNICTAVACMDSAAPLLIHDAEVHLASREGVRRLPLKKWFVDNRKTALRPGELLTHLSVELPACRYGGAYRKLTRYAGEDLAQANVGVLALEDGSFRVAFGAVGPIPKRSPGLEAFLQGKALTESVLEQAKQMLPGLIAPITDIRASKEYRLHMSMHMLEEALLLATDRRKNMTT